MTPGTITVTTHHTPIGPITRPLIIWDAAIEGDDTRWLVQWATSDLDAAATDDYREAYKPHGAAFILHHLGTNGLNWESESPTETCGGVFGSAGIVTIGHYEASDEAANSVEIMAEAARKQATPSAEDAITLLGATLIAAREHEESVSKNLQAAVRAGVQAGLSERRMAGMARVTRMTIRAWLGK